MILRDPAPIEGGGGMTPPPTPEPTPDLPKAADALVAKHGDATAALLVLMGENYKLRDNNRDLKGKLPADGTLVLKADEAKAWEAYQGLGKPSEVRKALEEGVTHRTEVEKHAREKHHNEVAAVAWPNSKGAGAVLNTLATRDNLALVLVDGKDKAGKAVKVAIVKGEGDKTEPLAEYAEKNWQEFLPALKADAKPTAGGSPFTGGYTPPRPQVETKIVPRVNSL